LQTIEPVTADLLRPAFLFDFGVSFVIIVIQGIILTNIDTE
jgi:hypothetical protein